VEKPVLAIQVVLDGNAQLDLGRVVQKLNDQVVIVKLESSPQLPYTPVTNHQTGLLLSLLKDRQPSTIDSGDFLLPTSKERRLSDFSHYLRSLQKLLADRQFALVLGIVFLAHKL
jgi:hypothetical protein